MNMRHQHSQKLEEYLQQTLFCHLPDSSQRFVRDIAIRHRLSFQEIRQISEIGVDFKLWQSPLLEQVWPDESTFKSQGKQLKQQLLRQVEQQWNTLMATANAYQPQSFHSSIKVEPVTRSKGKLGLGYCPVASEKTRCCNLLTLDAVDNCGYGCSYCSIQSFFDGKEVSFDPDFAHKLQQLELDPDKTYHIGTGQSSDSLMWGNSHGVLEALIEFCRQHPNVILELKTKSANIKYLLSQDLPANMLFTWSLNTPTIIDNEEHGTASLDKRLQAARAIADKGNTVGFHFHPMVHYDQWHTDYPQVIQQLAALFSPSEVALISLGTLTYIRPVIQEIRSRGIPSQILKMPLVPADGKLSYSDEIKIELFHTAYHSFPKPWQQQVFFYLCMENQRFWQPVFGYEYTSNQQFESAMKSAYLDKIQNRRPSDN